MIVSSFFTGQGHYADLATQLRTSCERLAQRYSIVEIQDAGSWGATNNLKPGIILAALLNSREPILYCDADCELMAVPKIPDEADFGCLNWKAHPQLSERFGYDPGTLLSSGGVLYFGYTAPAIELLIRWQEAITKNPQGVDDHLLNDVVNNFRPPIKAWWMPPQMNWMDGLWGPPTADTIIWHKFANRAHRES